MALTIALRLILTISALLLALGWQAAVSRADVTLSVAPSLVQVVASSAGEGSQELTVYNDGSEPFRVAASVEPYKGSKDNQSAVEWLRVEPASFDLAPGQQRQAKVTIVVPAGAQAGGRYAMVAFKTLAGTGGGSGAGVAGQIGIPFLISVGSQGALTRHATLEKLVPVLQSDGRVGFRALLANRGNLHVVAQGAVEVSGADGTPAGRLDFPETTAILPQTDETLIADGSIPLQDDTVYRARATVEYGGPGPASFDATFKARAKLVAENLRARENFDKGPTLQLDLRNDGEVGITPRVQFALRNAEGRIIGTAGLPRPPFIWPGQAAEFETVFPQRLGSGEYALAALVEYGNNAPIRMEIRFRIGGPLPTPNPVWGEAPERSTEPAAAFPWWLAAALALAVVGAGVGWLPAFGPFRRRLRRAVQVLREDG